MNDGTDIAAGFTGAGIIGLITLREPGPFPLLLAATVLGITALFFGYRFYVRHTVKAHAPLTSSSPEEEAKA